MGYPKPPSGGLSGADGLMQRQGSGGHLAWNPYDDDREQMFDRRNCNENNGNYFSDSPSAEDY